MQLGCGGVGCRQSGGHAEGYEITMYVILIKAKCDTLMTAEDHQYITELDDVMPYLSTLILVQRAR